MKKYIEGVALIVLIGFTNIGNTQTIYKIQDAKIVQIKLKGTSTLHDWEMDADKASGEAQFIFNPEDVDVITSLEALTVNLKVNDLKSDSKGLDKNAYTALKSDKYKNIHYILSSSTISPENRGYLLSSNGKLTVAGKTKDISMDIFISVNENNTIVSKGEYKLNMTEYDVEPPSFMLGLMNTGDAVTLSFEVIFIKQIEG